MSEPDPIYNGRPIKSENEESPKQSDKIEKIKAAVAAMTNNPQSVRSNEERSAELMHETLTVEIEKLRQELQDIKWNRWMRIIIGAVVMGFEVVYIFMVLDVLRHNTTLDSVHQLSDGVLIALLTTTTANMLALLAFIIKYLFPQRR